MGFRLASADRTKVLSEIKYNIFHFLRQAVDREAGNAGTRRRGTSFMIWNFSRIFWCPAVIY
jgi:hypothetical protein